MSLKFTEELHVMAIKNYAEFKQKLTFRYKIDMRNLTKFDRLRNSNFILESKLVELNQNKNLKKLGRPDAVRKLYLSWK